MMIKWLHPTSTPLYPNATSHHPTSTQIVAPTHEPDRFRSDFTNPTGNPRPTIWHMGKGRRYPLTKCTHIYTGTLTVLYKSITPWRPAPIASRVRCSSPTAQATRVVFTVVFGHCCCLCCYCFDVVLWLPLILTVHWYHNIIIMV